MLHEIRSYVNYHHLKSSLGYWATPSGSEVDFVWWYGQQIGAIEVKPARRYRREFMAGIHALLAGGAEARSYIVYGGDAELEIEGTRGLHLVFLRRLHAGEILG